MDSFVQIVNINDEETPALTLTHVSVHGSNNTTNETDYTCELNLKHGDGHYCKMPLRLSSGRQKTKGQRWDLVILKGAV